jgi:hypothetical protein
MRRVKTQLFWLALLAMLSVSAVIAAGQDHANRGASVAKSTVYVYRYKQFVGSALAPSVYCDDVELARMENGRYFMATLEPGKHTFRSNDPQSGVVLGTKPGEQYYLRVEIAAGMMKGHGRLVLMSREQASYELVSTKLKPLDANKVADKERVSLDEAHPQAAAPAVATPTKAAEPAPATPAPAAPTASTPAVEQHSVTGTTVSDNGPAASSMAGDQMSVADAARQARQKKQPQQPQQ